jgi:hypothetical protein
MFRKGGGIVLFDRLNDEQRDRLAELLSEFLRKDVHIRARRGYDCCGGSISGLELDYRCSEKEFEMTGLELVPVLFLGLIAGIVGIYVTRQPSQEKRPAENPRPAIGGAISKSSHV